MAPIPLQQQREAHLAWLTKIRDGLEQTKKTAWPFLEKEELQEYVQLLPPLDIDGDNLCDVEKRFFRPVGLPEDGPKLAELLALGRDKWPGGCGPKHCFPWHEASELADWFSTRSLEAARRGTLPKSPLASTTLVTLLWPFPASLCGTIANYRPPCVFHASVLSELDPMPSTKRKRRLPWYQYQLCEAFILPADSPQPHMAGLVVDSTDPCEGSESPADVLRSEALAAIALLHFQLRRRQCLPTADEALPVLLFTIMHDGHARITQVHLDASVPNSALRLAVRQSRLLQLRPLWESRPNPPPEPDAYLLLRWMACSPVSELVNICEGASVEAGHATLPEITRSGDLVVPVVGA